MEASEYVPFGSVPWNDFLDLGTGVEGICSDSPSTPGPPPPTTFPVVVGGLVCAARDRIHINQQARQQAAQKSREEMELRSVCCEFSIHPILGMNNRYSQAEIDGLLAQGVPNLFHVDQKIRMIRNQTTVSDRSRIATTEDDDEDDDRRRRRRVSPHTDFFGFGSDDDDENTVQVALSAFEYALRSFRGTYVARSVARAMEPRDRFSNLQCWSASGSETWYTRPPGDEHQDDDGVVRYKLNVGAYGTRYNLDKLMSDMEFSFKAARFATTTLFGMLVEHGVIGVPARINGPDDGMEKLEKYLNYAENGVSGMAGDAYTSVIAASIRVKAHTRIRHMHDGKAINQKIDRLVSKVTSARRARAGLPYAERLRLGALTFADVFTTDDVLKSVVEILHPMHACALLMVCKWQPDCLCLLKSRLPRLIIYQSPGVFPHHVSSSGDWFVHQQRALDFCVGFGYKNLRAPNSDEKAAAEPIIFSLPMARTPIPREERRYEKWMELDEFWNEKLETHTLDPLRYFKTSPVLTIDAVDAELGILLPGAIFPHKNVARQIASDAHPTLYWRDYEYERGNDTEGAPTPWHGRKNHHNYAVLCTYHVREPTKRLGTKIRIRATITGTDKRGYPLVLTTTSNEFSVMSTLKNATRASNSKRKQSGS